MSGAELHNPVTGHRYRCLHLEPGLLSMEVHYPAAATAPLEHYHPQQEERFQVLEGSLRVRIDGKERELVAGDLLTIPAGQPHAMWTTESAARVHWETRPALGTWDFFAATTRLAESGRLGADGKPGMLDGALLLHRFRREMRVPRMPRAVILVLSLLARMTGRR